MTLHDALNSGRKNNLDALRAVAAIAVVVSHAWPLAEGPGTIEPLVSLFGISLGGSAVLIFFFVSGLLISQSADRWTNNKSRFIQARIVRIWPGLAVALLISAGLAIIFGSTARPGEVALYVLRGLSLVSIQHTLTGAWADVPYPGAVNGPLWTLFYEVVCYICCAMLIWVRHWYFGLRMAGGIAAIIAIFVALQVPSLAYRLHVLAPLAFAFALGHIAWRYQKHIFLGRLSWLGTVILLAIAAYLPMGAWTLVWALALIVLLLAYTLPNIEMSLDLSYGIYIHGWPVAQACISLLPGLSAPRLAMVSVLATLPLAYLSWILIERPALHWARRVRPRTN